MVRCRYLEIFPPSSKNSSHFNQITMKQNYFGEILLWWGIFVMSTSYSSPRYAILFNILSPLFTCAILLFLSGIPGLEKKDGEKYGDKEEYVEYRRNTSCLIPLPNGIIDLNWLDLNQVAMEDCQMESRNTYYLNGICTRQRRRRWLNKKWWIESIF